MSKMDYTEKIYKEKFKPLYKEGKYDEFFEIVLRNSDLIKYLSEEEMRMIEDKLDSGSKKIIEEIEKLTEEIGRDLKVHAINNKFGREHRN